MRVFGHFVHIAVPIAALATVSAGGMSTTPRQAPAKDAAKVLAQAREALGGEKRLSAIRNFVATGRTQQVRGDNLVPIEFEIAVELPDKYVRKDEIPAQESGPTTIGFTGEELIQLPVAPTPPPGMGRAGAPGPPPAAQLEAMRRTRVAGVKQDFVRLTLGMFASSFSAYPLTFTYVGEAEAPQGRADVLEAKGPANFSLRFFVNSQTHLPIMVSWQAPGRPMPPRAGGPAGSGPTGPAAAPPGQGPPPLVGPVRGGQPARLPPGAGEAPSAQAPRPPIPGQPAAGAPPPVPAPGSAAGPTTPAPAPGAGGVSGPGRGNAVAPVELRIYYGDYRDVDGLQWPFRLRRASGTETTEETTFDRFRLNTKIDAKKFEVRK